MNITTAPQMRDPWNILQQDRGFKSPAEIENDLQLEILQIFDVPYRFMPLMANGKRHDHLLKGPYVKRSQLMLARELTNPMGFTYHCYFMGQCAARGRRRPAWM